MVNTRRIARVLNSYVEIGSHGLDNDPEEAPTLNLDLYKEVIEKCLLTAKECYYRKESQNYLVTNPVAIYVERVERTLEEEKVLASFLHPTSSEALHPACHRVLIEDHLERFKDGFREFLIEDQENLIG